MPPVLAVVVTHDPGPWFDETLWSLSDQTYGDLSVLVVDADSRVDPTPRVRDALPDAYVQRLDENPGYGAAVNVATGKVKGAAFYLLCHDDVALEPGAVRILVEEAFRTNAGVLGPKLVSWNDPDILLQVGSGVDRTGVTQPLGDRGELDQQQHDAIREVFVVPGACTLIRADLFHALGGFDPAITFLGDDLDLCWRAHLAGARTLVVPAARARHRESLGERRPDDRRRLEHRHRVRTILGTYRLRQLVRIVPRAALATLIEAVFALLIGRPSHAGDVLGAWTWNLRRPRAIWAKRRGVRAVRQVSDTQIRRLQSKGSNRVSAFLRGQIGRDDDRLNAIRSSIAELAADLRSPTRRLPIVATALVMLLLVIGSRLLIASPIPAIGEFAAFPSSPRTLLDAWLSGWRTAGLGSTAPAPTSYGLLGFLGVVLPGSMSALRQLLILGLLPLGVLGAFRMARPLGSVRAAVAASVVYMAVPVPYNALANGSWSGLVLYAASPWVLLTLARATRLAPFGPVGADVLTARRDGPVAADPRISGPDGPEGVDVLSPRPEVPAVAPVPSPERTLPRQILVLGLMLALAATVAPFVVAVGLLVAVAFALGSMFAFRTEGAGRMLATAVGGGAVAIVLHLPWSLDFLLPGADWSAFVGMRAGNTGVPVEQLLRFESGPFGAAPLGWAYLAAAALPLLVGRRWRLEWAVRGWFVALTCWGVLWAGDEGWLPVRLPPAEVLLAPAAAALALATALGLTAFEVDLPGYRFGWRQLVSLAAALAVVAGALPLFGGVVDGRWKVPVDDLATPLATVEPAGGDDAFRVLWLGDPGALPVAGWQLDDDVAYATTEHLRPGVQDLWAGSPRGAGRRLSEAIETATERGSTRLGRLLGPMGVRYVVVPLARASGEARRPPPTELTDVLAGQLDLERIELDPDLILYRNTAWMPYGAAIDDGLDRGDPSAAGRVDLSGADAVLTRRDGLTDVTGRSTGAGTVATATAAADGWELTVDGRRAERVTAWGWANEFDVDRAGPARLRYETPITRPLWLTVQVVLWLAAIALLVRARRRAVRSVEAP